jgi:hypothetical protein
MNFAGATCYVMSSAIRSLVGYLRTDLQILEFVSYVSYSLDEDVS